MNASGWSVERLGEEALLLRLDGPADAATNARVHALAAGIAAQRPPWLREIVPAYASLALLLDPDADAGMRAVDDPLQHAIAWLRVAISGDVGATATDDATSPVDIPVCYDAAFAPDLDALAAHAGLPRDAVVARHAGGDYTVAMLGFAPGFPYLLGLDHALAMPRLATPRTHVAAGSVGIGGAQAGIYPREGPGGWRIVGRTPLRLFDATRAAPTLLAPGMRVRFVPIDAATFARLSAA